MKFSTSLFTLFVASTTLANVVPDACEKIKECSLDEHQTSIQGCRTILFNLQI